MRARAMAAVGPQLGVITTIAEVQEACNACSKCAAEHPRDIVPLGNINRGQSPCARLAGGRCWDSTKITRQVLYFDCSRHSHWPFVCTAATHTSQDTTVPGLEQPMSAYGTPPTIQSDQGTHFAGHKVQTWAQEKWIQWKLHMPYRPQAAGMIEQYNGC
jgi:hypothetical protein